MQIKTGQMSGQRRAGTAGSGPARLLLSPRFALAVTVLVSRDNRRNEATAQTSDFSLLIRHASFRLQVFPRLEPGAHFKLKTD